MHYLIKGSSTFYVSLSSKSSSGLNCWDSYTFCFFGDCHGYSSLFFLCLSLLFSWCTFLIACAWFCKTFACLPQKNWHFSISFAHNTTIYHPFDIFSRKGHMNRQMIEKDYIQSSHGQQQRGQHLSQKHWSCFRLFRCLGVPERSDAARRCHAATLD